MKNTVYTKKSKSGIRRKADIIVSALIGISVYLFNVTPIPDNLPLKVHSPRGNNAFTTLITNLIKLYTDT